MKVKTPLITLGVGLALAAVLFAVNMSINRDDGGAVDTAAPASNTPTTEAVTETPTPTPTVGDGSGPAGAGQTITYAGWVDGDAATLAIVVNNGMALAYVCDGASAEAWLEGPMANGLISLTGAGGSLTGTYGNGQVTGEVTTGATGWHFTIPVVEPPSGPYRSAEELRTRLDASWVVLPDGTQVGVERTGGTRRPAPPFDLTAGTVTVGGTTVPIEPADPQER
jgi:serine/threonine-protein kinase